MKRFLDLGGLRARRGALAPGSSRGGLEKQPEPRALAGRILGLLFFNPLAGARLRVLSGRHWRALGGNLVRSITGGAKAAGNLETRPGAVMDGAAAEHVRRGHPRRSAPYCDALGIRAFGRGPRDLASDLAETTFQTPWRASSTKPLINSRVRGQPSLPRRSPTGRRSMTSAVPARRALRAGRGPTTRAPLPLAVPAAALHMGGRCAAMESHRAAVRRAFALSRCHHGTRAAARRRLSGGSVRERPPKARGERARPAPEGPVCKGVGRDRVLPAIRKRMRAPAQHAPPAGACGNDWFTFTAPECRVACTACRCGRNTIAIRR